VAAVWIAARALGGDVPHQWSVPWFAPFGEDAVPVSLGILVDGLTATMLVVVGVVSFLVHVFSMGYMKGDPKYANFFAWLQMFSFSMLLVVMADNLFLLFVGWELVGLCSYKLIGFWSERKAPADAARKAFITTRIGDVGMVVALMVVFAWTGRFDIPGIRAAVESGALSGTWLAVAGFGVLAAAAGKSAQLGFHVWLPDAMEGPTPVSALIHAATMVAAGVYLLGRTMFMLPADVLAVTAVLGAATALVAGLIAVAQDDIKKVLAYSTVSQLGYMFLGIGVGAWHAALFHLTTHAFFKALMFLGSGSVIHACHHEQDMRRMGGLLKKMPWTGATFAVGVLAIAGFPFLSGFYSKDAILSGAYHRFPVLFWIGLAAAVLTAFYMVRLFVMTFLGKPREVHAEGHVHESGASMVVPLVALAALALSAGWPFLAWHANDAETGLLQPPEVVVGGVATVGDVHHFEHSGTVMFLAILAGLGGLALGWLVFSTLAARLDRLKRPLAWLETACRNKFWFDEFWRYVLLRPAYALARWAGVIDAEGVDGVVNGVGRTGRQIARVAGLTDARGVDGVVNGVGDAAQASGARVSALQSGRVRFYLSLAVGAVAVSLILLRVL
jgi:NADH-quinone oxidoreductase subunit L